MKPSIRSASSAKHRAVRNRRLHAAAYAEEALNDAFVDASPRVSPRGTTVVSALIHVSVLVAWLVLLARACFENGLTAWSIGVAYVVYDTLLLAFIALKTLPLLKQARKPRALAPSPTLGVVIAAYNEAVVLPVTLDALLEQDSQPCRIIVADDGSNDGTAELLIREYGLVEPLEGQWSAASQRYPNLYWLRLSHAGKACALNAAIAQIDTDIIMTVDADTRLARDACLAMCDAFAREPELVAATGIFMPICARTVTGRFFQWFQTYEYIRNFISRFAWMRADSLLLVSGAFACFRRHALVSVGGFDPECLVEDYELIHRLRRYAVEHGKTWHVRVIGTAQALTDAPGSLQSFLRQRRRWFAGFLQTQYWNRDITGNPRYGLLGLLMMPVKAVDTLQPVYGLAAFTLLPIFICTGRFSVLLPASGVIAAKIAIDLAFHIWSVHLYRRWTADHRSTRVSMAILASLIEPFSFQLLRHTGAALGWLHVLTARRYWGIQERTGLTK
ncbi:glycosyltransferase family 2 protein [Burkholderia cepacia]|uniref:glycosyltransferase family 2 protein n=1 Tax=Burkholderia cepacia TaxID=292 RepID=UPI000F5A44B3|nr:glycosyltransferase [Burkholderia cepacia]RQU90581.1 glycosyltransferase family 2 protein [Burkholderia cenocepacia]RQV30328.1 glycosyltransferase family 2 protein [Burkholderia cenocepacia]RQV88843.1 glycosyltransferase family 2 protein [Burkholderia cenocepacia]RQZ91047.1 glycosyltransferase family 2 protein [Burkholderia cepacia]RQZ98418.1 glycosyltransferase family 2 protein [Burkholderia cenocepacia]